MDVSGGIFVRSLFVSARYSDNIGCDTHTESHNVSLVQRHGSSVLADIMYVIFLRDLESYSFQIPMKLMISEIAQSPWKKP